MKDKAVNVTTVELWRLHHHDHDAYNTVAFKICAVLFGFAFFFALLQTFYRCWMDMERDKSIRAMRERQRAPRSAVSRRLLQGRTEEDKLTVSGLDRSRLFYVSNNLTLSFVLRTAWLLLTVYEEKNDYGEGCYDPHTFISACNRLAQLLYFTAMASVVGFWATILRHYQRSQSLSAGLSAESEIASVLAQSTTRRRPGEAVVVIPDLFQRSEGADAVVGAELADQQGFNALCSFFCMLLTPDFVQILLNFWVYVLITILLIVQYCQCDKEKYNSVDKAQTVTIAFFFAVLSVMYLVYGLRLIRALRTLKHSLRTRMIRNTIIIMFVCMVLFGIRAVLFLLDPMFSYRLTGLPERVMYPWFFYAVPELVPGLLVLYIMSPRPRRLRLTVDAQSPLLEHINAVQGQQHGLANGALTRQNDEDSGAGDGLEETDEDDLDSEADFEDSSRHRTNGYRAASTTSSRGEQTQFGSIVKPSLEPVGTFWV